MLRALQRRRETERQRDRETERDKRERRRKSVKATYIVSLWLKSLELYVDVCKGTQVDASVREYTLSVGECALGTGI